MASRSQASVTQSFLGRFGTSRNTETTLPFTVTSNKPGISYTSYNVDTTNTADTEEVVPPAEEITAPTEIVEIQSDTTTLPAESTAPVGTIPPTKVSTEPPTTSMRPTTPSSTTLTESTKSTDEPSADDNTTTTILMIAGGLIVLILFIR